MTPAEELAQAADKLDALAAGAAPDWQLSDSNHLALPMIEMPYMVGPLKGQPGYTLSGPNDATTLYIAAMNPLVGKALAASFRSAAALYELRTARGERPDRLQKSTFALARLINGNES